MKHPPYHLRPNKAVDRYLLVETLQRLSTREEMAKLTYYGFGGPFLEDCRLLGELCPDISLVSLESNSATFKRQEFHRFTSKLKLENRSIDDFIATYRSKGREIFWLDYTDLKMKRFDEFMLLLGRAANGTVVKVSLRAQRDNNPYLSEEDEDKESEQFQDRLQVFREEFESEFGQILPRPVANASFRPGEFPGILQSMLQVAAQKILPAECARTFQILHSVSYDDGTCMLSVAGTICERERIGEIRSRFENWEFSNLDWNKPMEIDVPVLSVRERLLLEKHLPVEDKAGQTLAEVLGYKIDKSKPVTINRLEQFAKFYRYYPNFIKVTI